MGLRICCLEIQLSFQACLLGRTLIPQPLCLFVVGRRTTLTQHKLPFLLLLVNGTPPSPHEASGIAVLLKYSRLY